MSDLVEFLNARLKEDEREATLVASAPPRWTMTVYPHDGEAIPVDVKSVQPGRLLAEVEAKRRILEVHEKISAAYPHATIESDPCCSNCSAYGEYPGEGWPCNTLRLIALPYSDYPDYRQEWKP